LFLVFENKIFNMKKAYAFIQLEAVRREIMRADAKLVTSLQRGDLGRIRCIIPAL
jgi:hypothetical protein